MQISIHALREEGDFSRGRGSGSGRKFLSTPSARRATGRFVFSASVCVNFYPRPPRGGRRQALLQKAYRRIFLSTPSARRATPRVPAL